MPRKIPNPPNLGIGILFCFLKSTKSKILPFMAYLFIKGNEKNETKNAIKELNIIITKFYINNNSRIIAQINYKDKVQEFFDIKYKNWK